MAELVPTQVSGLKRWDFVLRQVMGLGGQLRLLLLQIHQHLSSLPFPPECSLLPPGGQACLIPRLVV